MNLEPGIYRATVRGVPDQIMMVHDSTNADSACTVGRIGDLSMHSLDAITDARPLIVLDLNDSDAQQAIWQLRAMRGGLDTRRVLCTIAGQIEAAQSRPPRIPEPGLWGVVFAKCSRWDDDFAPTEWVKRDTHRWQGGGGFVTDWQSLVDPTLIRPGIEDSEASS